MIRLILIINGFALLLFNDKETPAASGVFLGDPFILVEEGTYFMYGTSSADGIKVYWSRDMKYWKGPVGATDGLALHKKDVYGEKWFWAPEVYKVGNRFYMFFSVEEHIAIASSDSPLGPFIQEKEKILIEEKAIDNHLFIDSDGKRYLYYVKLENGNSVWMAEMEDDLSGIKQETKAKCFERSQEWERSPNGPRGAINEGPFVLKKNSGYFLVYSANHFESPDYGVGYATATDPRGPWVKSEQNPILQSPNELWGTGHCSLFEDQGRLYMVFHAHFSGSKVHPRKVFISECHFRKSEETGQYELKVDTTSIMEPVLKKKKS